MPPKDILSLILYKMNEKQKPDLPFIIKGIVYFPGTSDISYRDANAFRNALIHCVNLTEEESATMFKLITTNHNNNHIYGVDTDGWNELRTLIKLNKNND